LLTARGWPRGALWMTLIASAVNRVSSRPARRAGWDVTGGVLAVHAVEGAAHPDALVERSERDDGLVGRVVCLDRSVSGFGRRAVDVDVHARIGERQAIEVG
jgi:hypothetical protein